MRSKSFLQNAVWLAWALAGVSLPLAVPAAPGRPDAEPQARGDAPPAASSAADWRVTVRRFAQEHFKNPAWGYSHSQRDYSLARALAASDHVTLDDDVLFAAAYLHDMAAFPPWANEKLDHSDIAADAVDGILKDTGFPMAKIDAVRGAIRTHMFYREPAGPAALYLHDADALDWLGAIGAARIFGIVDPKGGDPDGPKAAKMLEDSLANVPAHVRSPAGRALLPERSAQLKRFLQDLRSETDAYHEL